MACDVVSRLWTQKQNQATATLGAGAAESANGAETPRYGTTAALLQRCSLTYAAPSWTIR